MKIRFTTDLAEVLNLTEDYIRVDVDYSGRGDDFEVTNVSLTEDLIDDEGQIVATKGMNIQDVPLFYSVYTDRTFQNAIEKEVIDELEYEARNP